MCAPKNQRQDQYFVENITSCWKDTRSPQKKEDFPKFLGCAVHPKSASDIKNVDEKLLEIASQLYESDSQGRHWDHQL